MTSKDSQSLATAGRSRLSHSGRERKPKLGVRSPNATNFPAATNRRAATRSISASLSRNTDNCGDKKTPRAGTGHSPATAFPAATPANNSVSSSAWAQPIPCPQKKLRNDLISPVPRPLAATLSRRRRRRGDAARCRSLALHSPLADEDRPMSRTSRFRACPLCEAICGLDLQYEGDTLTAIRGDDADPFSRGHICPKGNAILDLEADPDRLRQPMRRVGSDWQAIGWDEAFALAGEKLATIQQAHGAAAVATYLGNPNVHHFGHIAYLPALLKALRSPNVYSASSVDQWPHQLVGAQMYGHQFLLPIPDVDRCDYFLMLGANPVASNGSLMTAPGIAKRLNALTTRGKLVLIDPRRTDTAAIASEHHFIRPGSDAWFLVALLQQMHKLSPPRVAAYDGKLTGL